MRKLLMQSGGGGTFREFYVRQGLPLFHVPSDAEPSLSFTNEGTGLGAKIKLSPDNQSFIGLGVRNKSYGVWRSGVAAPYATQAPSITFPAGTINDVAISNTHFAICGTSPFLYLYTLSDMFVVQIDTTGLGECKAVAFSPDGSKLAVAHVNGTKLRLYDLGDGSYIDADVWPTDVERASETLVRLAFVDGGARVAAVSNRYEPLIHVYATETLEHEYNTPTSDGYRYNVTGNALFMQNPLRPSDVVFARIERANTMNGATLSAFDCSTKTTTLIAPYTWQELPFGTKKQTIATQCVFSKAARELYVMLATEIGSFAAGDAMFLAVYDADTYAFKRFESIAKEGGNITTYLGSQQWQKMLLIEDGASLITGTVRDINNAPCARTVRAFRRSDGVCMAQTESDATTGDYRLLLPDAGPYDVQFQALDGENLNDLFFARSEPEPIVV